MIDRSLRDRYSRQTAFPPIREEGQAKLAESTAVIIGCGALGTHIATLLARAGVGDIRIIDRDFIEYHNLQRQVLFDEGDVKAGLPKALAAARHLRKVNSSIKLKGIVADVNFTNVERFCRDATVILDGLDNLETRFLINDASLKHGIPWVYGGAIASSGMMMTVVPGETACFRCLHPALPTGDLPTCETAGVVGTAPAVIAALQATEAIKLMVGAPPNPDAIFIDVWKGSFDHLKVKRREDCPACHGKYDFLDAKFEVKTTSFCGQSRAVQVIDTRIKKVNLGRLAAGLRNAKEISRKPYLLRFTIGDNELIVFPDGRAIVKDTLDESLAKELYARYIAAQT